MPSGDVPPPTAGRISILFKHRARITLLALMALVALCHRPILRAGTLYLLKSAARQHGLDLQARISGDVLSGFEVHDFSVFPHNREESGHDKVQIKKAGLRYSLWNLVWRGRESFITEIYAEEVDLIAGHSRKTARQKRSGPIRSIETALALPLFCSRSIQITGLNVEIRGGEGRFSLRNGSLTAFPGKHGRFSADALALPGQAQPIQFESQTTYENGHFILNSLHLGDELTVERFDFHSQGRSKRNATLDLDVTYGKGSMKAGLVLGEKTWTAKWEAADVNVTQLAQLLGLKCDQLIQLTSATVEISGAPALPMSWKGSVEASSTLGLNKKKPVALHLQATVGQGAVALNQFSIESPNTTISSTGTFQLPLKWPIFTPVNGTIDSRFHCSDLAEWLQSDVGEEGGGNLNGSARTKLGKAGMQVELKADAKGVHSSFLDAEHFTVEASLSAPLFEPPSAQNLAGNAIFSIVHPRVQTVQFSAELEEAAGGISLDGGMLRLWNLNFRNSHNSLTGEISWPLTSNAEKPRGNLEVRLHDLRSMHARLLGQPLSGSLIGILKGHTDNLGLQGALAAEGASLMWGDFELGQTQIRADATDNTLTVGRLSVEWNPQERLTASGKLLLGDELQYSVDASFALPKLERFAAVLRQTAEAPKNLSGSLEGHWKGEGNLGSLQGAGDWTVRIKDAQWGALHLQSVDCAGRYGESGLNVDPLKLATKDTKLSAQIQWNQATLKLGNITLEQWGHPVLRGNIALPIAHDSKGFHWAEEAQLSGELHADKLDIKNLFIGAGRTAALEGTIQFALTLGGSPGVPVASLNLSATDFHLREAPKFGPMTIGLTGEFKNNTVTGNAVLKSPLVAPVKLQAKLQLPVGELMTGEQTPENIAWEGHLQTAGATLDALPNLWKGFRQVHGSASLDLHGGGSLGKPVWRGNVSLDCPTIHFSSDRAPAIGDLHANISYADSVLQLNGLKADLGGGNLLVHGAAHFKEPGNPTLDFEAKAREVLVVRNRAISLRLNGGLFLRGPWNRAVISGSAYSIKSRLQKDIEVLPLNALRTASSTEARPTGRPWFTFQRTPFSDWRFDVDLHTTAGDPVLIRGNRLRGSMDADIRLEGTGAAPTLHGAYRTHDLVASLPFARIELSQGRIWYTRDLPFQPHLEFSAETEARNHRIRMYLYGPSEAPKITLNSEPPQSETDLLTLLTTGTLPSDAAENSQALAARAAAVLFQEFSGKVLASPDGKERLSALRRFNLDVGALNSRTGQQETRLSYRLQDNLFLIGEIGSNGDFAGRFRYLLRFR